MQRCCCEKQVVRKGRVRSVGKVGRKLRCDCLIEVEEADDVRRVLSATVGKRTGALHFVTLENRA